MKLVGYLLTEVIVNSSQIGLTVLTIGTIYLNVYKGIKCSIQHLDATKLHSICTKTHTIDAELEKQYSDEAMMWRNILKRLIKIILYLTGGNSALRGNEGSKQINTPTEENFLRTVYLLAEFDPFLKSILEDKNQKIKYLSALIQNELIDILSTDLRRTICNEIRSSIFFPSCIRLHPRYYQRRSSKFSYLLYKSEP